MNLKTIRAGVVSRKQSIKQGFPPSGRG